MEASDVNHIYLKHVATPWCVWHLFDAVVAAQARKQLCMDYSWSLPYTFQVEHPGWTITVSPFF